MKTHQPSLSGFSSPCFGIIFSLTPLIAIAFIGTTTLTAHANPNREQYAIEATQTAAAFARAKSQALPFIGTKAFNFSGGSESEQLITIRADGTTQVYSIHPKTEKKYTQYKGKYQNPLPIEGGQSYYRIDGDYIEQLDSNRQLLQDCRDFSGNPMNCRVRIY